MMMMMMMMMLMLRKEGRKEGRRESAVKKTGKRPFWRKRMAQEDEEGERGNHLSHTT